VLYRRCQSLLSSHQLNGNYESDRLSSNTDLDDGPEADWARYDAPSSTYIFVAHRRNISIDWSVPEDDKDLLEGVGARGDQRRKGDDTFDLMLLMSLVVNED
jgi:hypothetical protein